MLLVALHVSEPVGADPRSRMNGHPVADARAAVHRYGRKQLYAIAELDAGAHATVCSDDRAVADPHAFIQHRVRPNRDVTAEPDTTADHRGGVNPGGSAWRAMEAREQR